ncbi:MAG: hypothetical protein MUE71_09045 [Chitinophagaceae bacterium]|jgi:hypothetical protein|nr:hypothetical protein [Chitinophagaceae bacterium]
MQNLPLKIFCNLLGVLCLMSCRTPRYVYTTTTVNVPAFNKKGQGFAQASYGSSKLNTTNGHARGGDFLGAYSFHKNFGVQGRYSFRNEKDQFLLKSDFIVPVPDSIGTSTVFYKRHEFELGTGGFLPLNRSKSIVMHLWGGMGTGRSVMNEQNEVAGINYQRNLRYNTFRLYWQPHISFVPSPYFNISYFFKFSRIYFKNISTDLNEAELMPRMLNDLSAKSLPITEGGYSLNFGFRGMEGFRIQQQLTIAGSHGDRSLRGLNLSLGLQYNFGNIH